VAHRMAPLRVTFSDLKGHFCCLKPLCPSTAAIHVHDDALAEWHAVSSTTLVVVDVRWSHLRSSWHQQDWLYGSLLMTCTALHSRCAIIVPIVQRCVYKSKKLTWYGLHDDSVVPEITLGLQINKWVKWLDDAHFRGSLPSVG